MYSPRDSAIIPSPGGWACPTPENLPRKIVPLVTEAVEKLAKPEGSLRGEGEESCGEHGQGDMAVPGVVAADSGIAPGSGGARLDGGQGERRELSERASSSRYLRLACALHTCLSRTMWRG